MTTDQLNTVTQINDEKKRIEYYQQQLKALDKVAVVVTTNHKPSIHLHFCVGDGGPFAEAKYDYAPADQNVTYRMMDCLVAHFKERISDCEIRIQELGTELGLPKHEPNVLKKLFGIFST